MRKGGGFMARPAEAPLNYLGGKKKLSATEFEFMKLFGNIQKVSVVRKSIRHFHKQEVQKVRFCIIFLKRATLIKSKVDSIISIRF